MRDTFLAYFSPPPPPCVICKAMRSDRTEPIFRSKPSLNKPNRTEPILKLKFESKPNRTELK